MITIDLTRRAFGLLSPAVTGREAGETAATAGAWRRAAAHQGVLHSSLAAQAAFPPVHLAAPDLAAVGIGVPLMVVNTVNALRKTHALHRTHYPNALAELRAQQQRVIGRFAADFPMLRLGTLIDASHDLDAAIAAKAGNRERPDETRIHSTKLPRAHVSAAKFMVEALRLRSSVGACSSALSSASSGTGGIASGGAFGIPFDSTDASPATGPRQDRFTNLDARGRMSTSLGAMSGTSLDARSGTSFGERSGTRPTPGIPARSDGASLAYEMVRLERLTAAVREVKGQRDWSRLAPFGSAAATAAGACIGLGVVGELAPVAAVEGAADVLALGVGMAGAIAAVPAQALLATFETTRAVADCKGAHRQRAHLAVFEALEPHLGAAIFLSARERLNQQQRLASRQAATACIGAASQWITVGGLAVSASVVGSPVGLGLTLAGIGGSAASTIAGAGVRHRQRHYLGAGASPQAVARVAAVNDRDLLSVGIDNAIDLIGAEYRDHHEALLLSKLMSLFLHVLQRERAIHASASSKDGRRTSAAGSDVRRREQTEAEETLDTSNADLSNANARHRRAAKLVLTARKGFFSRTTLSRQDVQGVNALFERYPPEFFAGTVDQVRERIATELATSPFLREMLGAEPMKRELMIAIVKQLRHSKDSQAKAFASLRPGRTHKPVAMWELERLLNSNSVAASTAYRTIASMTTRQAKIDAKHSLTADTVTLVDMARVLEM